MAIRFLSLRSTTMLVSRIAPNRPVSCHNSQVFCLPLRKRARGFVSLPCGLDFVCPTLELKLQSTPHVATYSSSRTAVESLPTVHDSNDGSVAQVDISAKARMDSGDDGFKRPEVIECEKELANNVKLIGLVGRDVQIKYLDTGKVVAGTTLRVAQYSLKKDKEDVWFHLVFWDELAEIAAAHLKKYDRIFVSGPLYLVKFTGNDNVERLLCKVMATDLKYVQTNGPSYLEGSYVGNVEGKKSDANQKADLESLWQAFFENPSGWWDNRTNKKNPRSPDFKNKISGEALWIDSWSNPDWVKSQLATLDSKAPLQEGDEVVSGQKSPGKQSASSESLWQAFFANPSEWWDNRTSKRNPKSPDFKHKTTGEALWIESCSSPNWLKSQLAALDSKALTAREEGKNVGWSSGQFSKSLDNPNSGFQEKDLDFF